MTWSTVNHNEVLVFVGDPFSTEVEYWNPINYNMHYSKVKKCIENEHNIAREIL